MHIELIICYFINESLIIMLLIANKVLFCNDVSPTAAESFINACLSAAESLLLPICQAISCMANHYGTCLIK